jgi:hypothetical protein
LDLERYFVGLNALDRMTAGLRHLASHLVSLLRACLRIILAAPECDRRSFSGGAVNEDVSTLEAVELSEAVGHLVEAPHHLVEAFGRTGICTQPRVHYRPLVSSARMSDSSQTRRSVSARTPERLRRTSMRESNRQRGQRLAGQTVTGQ